MKRFLKLTLMCAAAGVLSLATSCTDAVDNGADTGVVRVKLAVDASAVTRAESGVVAPEVADFDIEVASTDGEYTNRWESLTELTTDQRFEVGEYLLTATCGDVAQEGFDKTAFADEASCRVMPNQKSLVNMTAVLVNSGVKVSRSEAFGKYFSEVSVQLTTAAGTAIDFEEGESRIAFVAPESFELKVAYTKPNGTAGSRTFRVSEMEPRTIYNVLLDVNGGEVGQASIVVKFDDSVEVENVEIEIEEQ